MSYGHIFTCLSDLRKKEQGQNFQAFSSNLTSDRFIKKKKKNDKKTGRDDTDQRGSHINMDVEVYPLFG